MYLSKLEIFGFKSFAKKEIFQFDGGLTGVVGPNGCGKSNIVDAIRWVLGEQRPKILRCDRMENLIFNGTKTRKPLNFAEVALYIENNKNILPSEYTEIKISRRLYRSGESEYFINNQQVRLLDIVNLFADTGMGADAYSMIELKMVEQILSDNAEERRRLFEEAAGIKKYKIRRKSALRKLETTRQELTRVEDVIAEVQKTVNSLARQVGKARRYHQYKQELKDKDILLFRLKLRAYETDLVPLTEELEQVERSRDVLKKEVHTEEARLERLQAEAAETEELYRQLASRLYKEDEVIREIQNNQKLRKQRIDSLTENIQQQQSEIEALQARIDSLQKEEHELKNHLSRVRENQEKAQNAYRQSASAQEAAEQKHEETQKEYQLFVTSNLQELEQAAAAREAFQRVQIELENSHDRISKNRAVLNRLEEENRERESKLAAVQKELRSVQEEFDQYRAEMTHLQNAIENNHQELDNLRQNKNVLSGELESLRSRKEFLTRLIENYEGFSESVQFVMAHKDEFDGVVDTLANLLEIEPNYRPALESYVSEMADFLIVNKLDTAREILSSLQKSNRGRVTLIPPPFPEKATEAESAANSGAIPAREVMRFDRKYQPVMGQLFRNVFIVQDLDTALEQRRQHPSLTFVTKAGEVISSWGLISGGTPSTGNRLLGRRKELQSVSQQLRERETQLEALNQRIADTENSLATSRKKMVEFEQLKKETEQKLLEAEKRVGLATNELEHHRGVALNLGEEIEELSEKINRLEKEKQTLAPQLSNGEEKLTSYQLQEKEIAARQAEAEKTLREITRETQELQISYLSLLNEENSLKDKIRFTEEALKEARQKTEQLKANITAAKKDINALNEQIAAAEKKLDEAYIRRDATGSEKESLEQELQELRASIQSKTEELKRKNRLYNQARERVQDLELRIRELEIKRDSQAEQIQDKYGIEAVTSGEVEIDQTLTIAAVQEELETLHKKLEGLGDVNPLAIKEHEQEKERLDFLKTQQADLLTAEAQLLETIGKLNQTARKQFLDTFTKIRTNFQQVFAEFFEEGQGDLILVENHDPLEANIEFSITVKGKKLNALSLLSTGEKTLTAISLLFSIYLVKPSPFCILDEVDAPLDDLNITQFTRAIKRFSRDTQFILVTHNKRTMEAVGSLYGITMEEPGVSKVVSVRLD